MNVSVCLSIREHISGTTEVSVHVGPFVAHYDVMYFRFRG